MNLQLIVLLLDAVFTIGSCIELSDTHFMLNPSGHKRDKRAAVEDLYLWPNGVIPYDLHTYYTGTLLQVRTVLPEYFKVTVVAQYFPSLKRGCDL